MGGQIELRAFMDLRTLFGERGWSIPHFLDVEADMTGEELLRLVSIESARVESLIVNRSAISVEEAIIHPGDRVALVPPGVPGPHRVLLGIRSQKKSAQPFGLSFSATPPNNETGEGEEK